jgi:hypothetical protein
MCLGRFAKRHYWPKKFGKGHQERNKICIEIKFETQEIKHSSENKITLVFRHLIFCSIFESLLFLVYFNC